jgi:hypothetical protein
MRHLFQVPVQRCCGCIHHHSPDALKAAVTRYPEREVALMSTDTACIALQTSPEERPSVPAWFAEVVLIAQYLTQEASTGGSRTPGASGARALWAVRGDRLPRVAHRPRHQWGMHPPRFFYPSGSVRHALYGPLRTFCAPSLLQPESLSGRCGSG